MDERDKKHKQPSCLDAISGNTYGFAIEFKKRNYEYRT